MNSRVYTILLVIAGFVIAAFVMLVTGNIVLKTEPADETSGGDSAKIGDSRIVYVLPEAEEAQLNKVAE